MFAKLLAIIIALGVTGGLALSMRQQETRLAHDSADTHQRVIEHEQMLWRERAIIAALARPQRLRNRIDSLDGEWLALAVELERQRRDHTPNDRALVHLNEEDDHATGFGG